MPELTSEDIADQLHAGPFARQGPAAEELSDPIADTPMVVTLDQLRPYEHNPRVARNPLYQEIKTSIRERGLDSPPAITRRPGETHYIIRNGGNTRLAVLRELWSETHDERFFRLHCLFRPWAARGEIVALTGHLAENELHGGLSFIERALGVEKARELYEQEAGDVLSQSELARRLSADGFPLQQSHISRMHDAVQFLLPAMPQILYAGLGRHQVERLSVLRRASERVWSQNSREEDEFLSLFQDVLAQFDTDPTAFEFGRVQDELVGQMASALDIDYDALCLQIVGQEHRQEALAAAPAASTLSPIELSAVNTTRDEPKGPQVASKYSSPPAAPSPRPAFGAPSVQAPSTPRTTERLQSLQRLVEGGVAGASNIPPTLQPVAASLPVDTLYSVADLWTIDAVIDAPEPIRVHLAQLALEIAAEANLEEEIELVDKGLGFAFLGDSESKTPAHSRNVAGLLDSLSGSGLAVDPHALAQLLIGGGTGHSNRRLSDEGLKRLFRLLRLARRLVDLDSIDLT